MTVLHLVSNPLQRSSAFESCLKRVGTGDVVALVGSGVYTLTSARFDQLVQGQTDHSLNIVALTEDLKTRGIERNLPDRPWLRFVDYAVLVELAVAHPLCLTWV
jgi:sulfur relay protein TusB/DsrH